MAWSIWMFGFVALAELHCALLEGKMEYCRFGNESLTVEVSNSYREFELTYLMRCSANFSFDASALIPLFGMSGLIVKNCHLESATQFGLDDSLKYLCLSHNALVQLKSTIFNSQTWLTSLDLSNNNLETLPCGIFEKETFLQRLHLESNNLSKLEPGIFPNWLEYLNLSENSVTRLLPGVFNKLKNLKVLDLSNNDIADFQPTVFKDLSMLERLALSYNKMRANIFFDSKNLNATVQIGDPFENHTIQGSNLTDLFSNVFAHLNSTQLQKSTPRVPALMSSSAGAPLPSSQPTSPATNSTISTTTNPMREPPLSTVAATRSFLEATGKKVDANPHGNIPLSSVVCVSGLLIGFYSLWFAIRWYRRQVHARTAARHRAITSREGAVPQHHLVSIRIDLEMLPKCDL